jgi:uncharacterized protein YecT (DUF1311 family)
VVITADLVSCLAKARAAADEKLNATYTRIRGILDTADIKRLVVTQRLWIQYRDANCAAERDVYKGGTAAPPAFLTCMEAMTRARTKELLVTYTVALKVAVSAALSGNATVDYFVRGNDRSSKPDQNRHDSNSV